jgi:tetratricopeptide (TPR) repeat protein
VTARAHRLAVWLLLAATAFLTLACPSGEPTRPEPGAVTVPDPDLSTMEPALVRWLRGVREEVTTRLADPDTTAAEAARGLGELGQLYLVFGLTEAAEDALGEARRLDPEAFRWVYLHGGVLRDRGDLEGAAAAFEEALRLEPASVAVLVHSGDLEMERGHPEAAEQRYRRALEARPDTAAALFGLGRVAAETGDPATAVEHFRRVLELEPQASVVYYQLAQAYRALGRTEEAEAALARRGDDRVPIPDSIGEELGQIETLTAYRVALAWAANPPAQDAGADAERLFAFFLTQLGDVEGTLAQLEGELSRAEGRATAERARLHYLAGGLAVRQGRDERGLEHFRRAVELDPELSDARIKLGNALARAGRFEAAIEQFGEVLRRRPGDRDLAVKRATALLNLGRGRQAVEALEALVAEDPRDPVTRIRLAEALESTGALGEAEESYRQALRADLDPATAARLQKGYADFLNRRGRSEDALTAYRRSLELDPTGTAARRDYAALLGRLGRLEESAREYAATSARQPDEEAPRLGETAALLLAGRPREARGRLEEGVARLPRSHALANLLARLLAASPEASLRDGERAVALARRAFELEATPVHAETLAMALAERGEFAEAAAWQQRALDNLPAGAPGRDDAFARLTLYRGGRPYRATSGAELLP